jgi:predicted dithiol-disulfide oxidoreductase (DUF899 family)
MTNHKTGTREEWLAARLELLKAEKETAKQIGLTIPPEVLARANRLIK